MPKSTPPALVLADEPPRERADATRNRTRLLEVAGRLVAERGATNVSMDAVAAAAGVGKGTVFRRFGDRAGLMRALLDHAERELQGGFLAGPPPLGPGAPPAERLHAFGGAAIRHRLQYRDLYLEAEASPAHRFTNNPPREVLARHVASLLVAAGEVEDVELLTEALLAYLDTALVTHLHTDHGLPADRIAAGWSVLVDRVLCPLDGDRPAR
jgi:AcrR family transcriptional regulator